MPYLSYEQIATTAAIKTVSDLTVPVKATHVELQASGQHCSYTMDGSTNPTQTKGMFLLTTQEPKLFLIKDIRNIRFIRGGKSSPHDASGDGLLNIHYYGGRDV